MRIPVLTITSSGILWAVRELNVVGTMPLMGSHGRTAAISQKQSLDRYPAVFIADCDLDIFRFA